MTIKRTVSAGFPPVLAIGLPGLQPTKAHKYSIVRYLWLISFFVSVSSWMMPLIVTLHLLNRHSSSTAALVLLFGTAPFILFMPLSGVVVDRYQLKRITILAMALQLIGAGMMTLALVLSNLILLVPAYMLFSSAAVIWIPARQKWLYLETPSELRVKANAWLASLGGVTTIIGAVTTGIFSSKHPAWASLVANLLIVAALLFLIRLARISSHHRVTLNTTRKPANFFNELKDGIVAVKRFHLARSVILMGLAWGIIGGGYLVLLASHVSENLNGSAFQLGIIYAVNGCCLALGTAISSRLLRHHHVAIWAFGYLCQGLGFAAAFYSTSYTPLFTSLIVMNLASGLLLGVDYTLLLERVPSQYHGRIISVHMSAYRILDRLSLALIGGLLLVMSLQALGIMLGLLASIFSLGWWLFSGKRAQTEYRDPVKNWAGEEKSLAVE